MYLHNLVIGVSCNPFVGSFFLLPACTEELLSTPYIITFLPNPSPLDTEKNPRTSNTITYLEQEYLSESGFLFHLTAPNKKFLM